MSAVVAVAWKSTEEFMLQNFLHRSPIELVIALEVGMEFYKLVESFSRLENTHHVQHEKV